VKPWKLICFGLSLSVIALHSPQAQARDSANSAAKQPSISGIVKDQYDDPLPKAQVIVEPGNYSATTDESGKFRIQAPVGEYNVIFRHVGFGPEDFSWRARAGEGTELSIRLNPLPQALDTVVIRDSHNKAAGASSISGIVYDRQMKPVTGVELQLLGTGRHATSYERGEFFFAGLARGDYVIRARRMGYTPTSLPIKIGNGEEHDLSVILAALPTTLATVEIRDRSGYGASETAWEEFDKRQRWKSTNNYTVGRDVFGPLGKALLDQALRGTQAQSLINQKAGGYAPVSINGANTTREGLPPTTGPEDVCILINGVEPVRLPLSAFRADQVARVEVYAANSDFTRTIGSHMYGLRGCEPGDGFQHPAYFVIWMRGAN
jgi:hypothetical protein